MDNVQLDSLMDRSGGLKVKKNLRYQSYGNPAIIQIHFIGLKMDFYT